MYAVFETGGKQYRVSEGDVVFVERLAAEPGENVVFDKLLACSNETETDFGKPYLDDASVEARVLGHGKEKKIIVYKYKAKKNYRKKQGHRQPYTKVRVERIVSEKLGVAAYIGEPEPELETEDIADALDDAEETVTADITGETVESDVADEAEAVEADEDAAEPYEPDADEADACEDVLDGDVIDVEYEDVADDDQTDAEIEDAGADADDEYAIDAVDAADDAEEAADDDADDNDADFDADDADDDDDSDDNAADGETDEE